MAAKFSSKMRNPDGTPEVANSGYPGALLILALPFLLFGGMGGIFAVSELIAPTKGPPGTAPERGGVIFLLVCSVAVLLLGLRLVRKSVQARRALRPVPEGVCFSCGYDRSGIAIETKCPECGAFPAK